MPILIYGLECFSLPPRPTLLDFAVTRFLMKLFTSVNTDVIDIIDAIDECRSYFNFLLLSEMVVNRKAKFESKFVN